MTPHDAFTFRKEPRETGLAGVGNPYQNTAIKHAKKECGVISAPNWQTKDNKWRVRFTVKDAEEHCGWKWVQLKAAFDSEPEAREYVKTHAERILRMDLHYLESA